MSAVPEMINEQYAGKYTWKQITGDKKRLKPANPVQLSPGLSKHPLVRPDGTVKEAITPVDVLECYWDLFRNDIEELLAEQGLQSNCPSIGRSPCRLH
jgi:hypothetical protein